MKRMPSMILLLFLLFYVSSGILAQSQSQPRGQALYDMLRDTRKMREIIKFEGTSNVWWAPDGKSYIISEGKTFKIVDAETGDKSTYFDDQKIISEYNRLSGESVDSLPFSRFTFVHNNTKIRFIKGNRVFFFTLKTGELNAFLRERPITGVRGRIYYEVFSPNLAYRAYTRDFNLYMKDNKDVETALTTGGHEDLRKGFPDWVYPEELSQYDAYWWSPKSDKIAFMQFDESPVFKYPIVHDVSPMPRLELESYPKAGENNPIIKFFIIDIATQKTIEVDTGDMIDVYLMRGQWSSDGKLFFYQRMNRLQNKLELLAADPETGKSQLIFTETDDAYINLNKDMTFINDGKQFLWTSERSGWKEVYLHDIAKEKTIQLTDAKLPVGRLLGVNEDAGWVYFNGYESRGKETHLYRVKLDGSGFARLTKKAGTHSINLAPGGAYYTDSFSSYDTPRKVAIYKGNGEFVRELGATKIDKAFTDLKLIKPENIVFKAADGKTDLDAVVFKPADFDPAKKYPMILSVYGGPEARQTYNRFLLNDRRQTLAQLGFIVLSTDHRGSGRRGKKFATQMYMKLGQIEVNDHAEAALTLSKRAYVDGSRVGIFGHSYGGYLTIMALLKKPDIFHVGVSGAPVTDWRNYDTIYTERYMRRPKDNPDGYEQNSAMNFAENLKGKLFIHHGAVDDNVHPGNSVQLLQALLKANKRFDFMLYPEQKHGIRFRRYRESRVEYFIEHLKPELN